MDGKEIMRRLVIGSAEIDRMKQEIELVMRSILGFLDPELRSSIRDEVVCTFQNCNGSWKVEVDLYRRISITFWHRENSDPNNQRHDNFACRLWTDPDKGMMLPMKYVQYTYETLPFFIESMMGRFPPLNTRMQPLFRVAEYAEKR